MSFNPKRMFKLFFSYLQIISFDERIYLKIEKHGN